MLWNGNGLGFGGETRARGGNLDDNKHLIEDKGLN